MIKLLLIAGLVCVVCKMLVGRWPWELIGGSARSQAETLARGLLGVRRSATREDIIDAHRRLVTLVHPDRGGTGEQVHEANAARDLLLARLVPRDTE